MQFLDIDAIYGAVRLVQDGIVKKIAGRCGRKEATFYKQQQREIGDLEPQRRPYLLFQILKQQAALETKPLFEACAELICEADHLGADVVWREPARGARGDLVDRLGALLGEAADVVAAVRAADVDHHLTSAELAEVKRQCRELRAAVDALELEAVARATFREADSVPGDTFTRVGEGR